MRVAAKSEAFNLFRELMPKAGVPDKSHICVCPVDGKPNGICGELIKVSLRGTGKFRSSNVQSHNSTKHPHLIHHQNEYFELS